MNKSIVSKLFLGIFLIFFMGSVFAAPTITVDALLTTDNTPSLSGTYDGNGEIVSFISIEVNSETYNITGTTGTFADGNWTLYDNEITALADGDYNVIATMTAGSSQYNDATTYELIVDTTPPTLDITIDDNALNIADVNAEVTFEFSEEVTGFTNEDINLDLANGKLTEVATGNNIIFTATFTPDANVEDLENVIIVDMTGVDDLAGNAGEGTESSDNYEIDTNAPTLTITIDDNELNIADTATITFTFSEAPTGFDSTDVVVGEANIDGINATDPLVQTATLTPVAGRENDSTYTSVAKTEWTDAAGNQADSNSNSPTYSVDTKAPTPVLTAVQTGPTNVQTIEMTVTFDENVTGFDENDITLGNATLLDFEVDANFTVYSFDINAISQGEVTVDINAGVAIDDYDNNNLAAARFSITYDTNAPTGYTVSFDQNYVNGLNQDAISFTIYNAEEDANYVYVIVDDEDANVTGSGTIDDVNYQIPDINLTDLSDGELTLTVTLTDPATNEGADVNTTITKDTVAPVITSLVLSADENLLGIDDEVTLTITADGNTYTESDITVNTEDVTDFTNLGDNTYTVVYTIAEDDTTRAEGDILASVVLSDIAGNPNEAETTVEVNTLAIDATRPTLTTVTIDSNNTNPIYAKLGELVTVTIESDENINNVVVTINGGATTLIAGEDDNHWSATQVMDVNDPEDYVNFEIAFEDLAGNAGINVVNEDIEELVEVLYDMTEPVVDLGADYYTTSEDIIVMTAGITEEGSDVNNYAWVADDNITIDPDDDIAASITMDTGLDYGTYTITLTVTDNAGNEGSDSFDIIYSAMYGFEFAGHTGQGFSAMVEEGWFSEYRFEQMDIWTADLNVDTFLNSTAGPTDERLEDSDVNVVYTYNETDGWVTTADEDFSTTNFYNLIDSLNYIVFDLETTATGKAIRHIAIVEE